MNIPKSWLTIGVLTIAGVFIGYLLLHIPPDIGPFSRWEAAWRSGSTTACGDSAHTFRVSCDNPDTYAWAPIAVSCSDSEMCKGSFTPYPSCFTNYVDGKYTPGEKIVTCLNPDGSFSLHLDIYGWEGVGETYSSLCSCHYAGPDPTKNAVEFVKR